MNPLAGGLQDYLFLPIRKTGGQKQEEIVNNPRLLTVSLFVFTPQFLGLGPPCKHLNATLRDLSLAALLV